MSNEKNRDDDTRNAFLKFLRGQPLTLDELDLLKATGDDGSYIRTTYGPNLLPTKNSEVWGVKS